jgi:hypothetical protein
VRKEHGCHSCVIREVNERDDDLGTVGYDDVLNGTRDPVGCENALNNGPRINALEADAEDADEVLFTEYGAIAEDKKTHKSDNSCKQPAQGQSLDVHCGEATHASHTISLFPLLTDVDQVSLAFVYAQGCCISCHRGLER